MNFWRLGSSVAVVAALVACGGGSDDPEQKELFSVWREQGSNTPVDLTGGAFSVPLNFSLYFTGGAQCNCNMTLIGDQSSGAYVINSCRFVAGSASQDPGCSALSDTGRYSNLDGVLTTTSDTGEVSTYR